MSLFCSILRVCHVYVTKISNGCSSFLILLSATKGQLNTQKIQNIFPNMSGILKYMLPFGWNEGLSSVGHHSTPQQLIWGLASRSQQDGAPRGQAKTLIWAAILSKGWISHWDEDKAVENIWFRSHTPSCASPCFQCEMSRTTSPNVKRNTDGGVIKRHYTFLTSCHVHRVTLNPGQG